MLGNNSGNINDSLLCFLWETKQHYYIWLQMKTRYVMRCAFRQHPTLPSNLQERGCCNPMHCGISWWWNSADRQRYNWMLLENWSKLRKVLGTFSNRLRSTYVQTYYSVKCEQDIPTNWTEVQRKPIRFSLPLILPDIAKMFSSLSSHKTVCLSCLQKYTMHFAQCLHLKLKKK